MDRDLEPCGRRQLRRPAAGGEHDLAGFDFPFAGLDAYDPVALTKETLDPHTFADIGSEPLCGACERLHPLRGLDLRVEGTEGGTQDGRREERHEIPRLVPGQQRHRHPVCVSVLDELAHDRRLALVMEEDEAPVDPEVHLGIELPDEVVDPRARCHDQVEFRALLPGMDPQETEVPPGRAVGQRLRLEQGDLDALAREVVRRGGADDTASDDQNVSPLPHAARASLGVGSGMTVAAGAVRPI